MSDVSVALRDFMADDVSAVFRWFNNEEATRFLVERRESFSLEQADDWVRRAMEGDGDDRKYAIVIPEREEPVGFTALYGLSRETGPELGALLGDDVRGRGIGRRAEAMTIAKAFDEFGVDRVYGEIPVFNERAKRAVAGLGWRYQETLPSYGKRNGKRFDCEVWAVLPEDFRQAAAELLA